MGNYNQATIRIPGSFTRAPEETERLFAGLESLVNLGDSYKEFCDFAAKCPTFCPIEFRNSAGRNLGLVQSESFHQLTKVFRNYLASVWRRDPTARREQYLKILLGMETKAAGLEPPEEDEPEWVALDASTPEALKETQRKRDEYRRWKPRDEKRSKSVLPEFDPQYRRALFAAMHDPERRGYVACFPQLIANWERGEFTYEPANDFQRAVYRLFRESWRARSCRQCGKLFVATKHPQMYCGTECSTIERRSRDVAYWKTKGAARRQKRNEKPRRKRGVHTVKSKLKVC
jgi:hypothetical protein